jgi:hypothetical protein
MKNIYNATKFICVALAITGIIFYVSSCKKNSNVNTNGSTTITEADAAQFASDAVSPSSGGMANQLSNSTAIYSSIPFSCGVQKDSTIVIASTAGATPAYNYTFAWKYVQNCTGTVANNITFSFTGKGNYNGPRMSAQDTSNAQFVLTGSTSSYLLTANFTRTGIVTSKIGRQYTFKTVLNIQSTHIEISKTSHEIISGTAAVTLVTTSSSGKNFTFSGVLTFLGNKKANMVLNSGVSYPIQWL